MADMIDIYIGATSFRTALGNKTESLTAIDKGETGLRYEQCFDMYAGVIKIENKPGYTKFESLIIEQIENIVKKSSIIISDNEEIQLVVSTTKGNVELLANAQNHLDQRVFLYETVERIADYFSFSKKPVVVSNACISGLSSLIVARDILISGKSKYAIVVGCDVLSKFITEGFASFKSIGKEPCRPYDVDRDGLTLGEACGAVLLTTEEAYASKPYIYLSSGAITNDANHISGPSRTGDGLYNAIDMAMKQANITHCDIGFINAHGTATRYNDEMESKAMALAGLSRKPLNSLKGYFGHTLGASGIVETIVCIEQLKRGYIFGTKGFSSIDESISMNVSHDNMDIEKKCCIKTASGFGGCNAAIVLSMDRNSQGNLKNNEKKINVISEYKLPASELNFDEYIRNEFRLLNESNMKFYKMSDICKALYVSMYRLFEKCNWDDVDNVRRAIVLSNRSASLDADLKHQLIVDKNLPEGASPSIFVYTLANVAIGEMCIRYNIKGDNTFFIESNDTGLTQWYAERLIYTGKADSVVFGWCEYMDGQWDVRLKLLK